MQKGSDFWGGFGFGFELKHLENFCKKQSPPCFNLDITVMSSVKIFR